MHKFLRSLSIAIVTFIIVYSAFWFYYENKYISEVKKMIKNNENIIKFSSISKSGYPFSLGFQLKNVFIQDEDIENQKIEYRLDNIVFLEHVFKKKLSILFGKNTSLLVNNSKKYDIFFKDNPDFEVDLNKSLSLENLALTKENLLTFIFDDFTAIRYHDQGFIVNENGQPILHSEPSSVKLKILADSNKKSISMFSALKLNSPNSGNKLALSYLNFEQNINLDVIFKVNTVNKEISNYSMRINEFNLDSNEFELNLKGKIEGDAESFFKPRLEIVLSKMSNATSAIKRELGEMQSNNFRKFIDYINANNKSDDQVILKVNYDNQVVKINDLDSKDVMALLLNLNFNQEVQKANTAPEVINQEVPKTNVAPELTNQEMPKTNTAPEITNQVNVNKNNEVTDDNRNGSNTNITQETQTESNDNKNQIITLPSDSNNGMKDQVQPDNTKLESTWQPQSENIIPNTTDNSNGKILDQKADKDSTAQNVQTN